MGDVIFAGADTYHCLKLNEKEQSSSNPPKVYNKPVQVPVSNLLDVEFTHFFVVFRKDAPDPNDYSWFMSGLGLSETQIFSSVLRVKQVTACKNAIVGLSEDGRLYKIKLEADDNRELVCLKTTEVKPVPNSAAPTSFSTISSNDANVYALHSSSECSRIFKVDTSLELVADFPGKHIVDFSTGHGHFVALSDTGGVWNWGHCGRSELASCSDVNVMSKCEQPRRVEFFDDLPCIVVKIVCGGWHTLALTSDGDIYSWGWNESGQLGHNAEVTSKSEPFPVDLGSAEDPVIDIAAGGRHSVALLKSGRLYAWGRNKEGQCALYSSLESSGIPCEIEKCWNGTVAKVKCGKWSTFIFTE